jgi:two-component system phosphate regulon sensor histidine kinase PhoR
VKDDSKTISDQELRRQLRGLSTLTAVSMVLNSTLDPEEVLGTIISAVTQVTGCQKSAIFDLDPTGTVLSLRMSHGFSSDFAQATQSLPVGDWWTDVTVTGEVVAVSDITTDSRFTGFVATAEGFRSFIDLPLIVQGQNLGCLTAFFTEPSTFTEFELELLAIFANQAASAMHNARLYDRLERRVRELSALVEIDKAMTAVPRLGGVLPGLAEGLCRVLEAAGGIILLWDAWQERGRHGATVGLSRQVLQLIKDTPDELLLVAETVTRREAVIVRDVANSYLVGERLAAQLGFDQLVGLPLMTGGTVVGVMVLGDPCWIEQESLDRAMLVARQAALAIANALLFEETSRQAQDLMALSRAAWAVASLGGLDTVLSQLLQELDRIVPADISAIYLHTEESETPVLMAYRGHSLEDGFGLEDATWQGLLKRVTWEKKPLLLGEQEIRPLLEGVTYRALGSLLCIPILYENRCLGVIALEHPYEDAFGQREQSLVISFADHAAVAIENAQRYDTVLQERNLIQTIIASMADGVVVTDAAGDVVMHNLAAQDMLDVQMGQRWPHDRMSDEPVGGVRALAEANGTALVGGQWQTTLERAGRVLSVSTTPLPSGTGENQGAVYVIRDITHWAELDQMKSDFISQVSHELRTPLTTIKMLVGLIGKGNKHSDEMREYLDIIESEVNRQAQLVNDLLEIGRLEAGEVRWTMVEVSLKELAEQAMRTCLPLAVEKQIELTGHPLPALPKVMGTPRRLNEVLVNLLGNAIKYTPPGGCVTVEAGSDEEAVWVAVRDTGQGIPKADLPHVFDKFYQVRRGGRNAEGVGLGLAIARQIIEALEGTIEVESVLGSGSCFTVRLPRARKIVAQASENLKGVDDERPYFVDR